MKLTKKHDEFVKKCLTDIGMAREFLQTYLPPMVKDKCNFNNLRIDSGSYIEDDLKAHASDIVYQVDLINKGSSCVYIYCMVEHQSSPDELMPYRILRYQ
ncbi:MAG: Rpn family recombination-promoting nuclease/putative transposase, partial [Burkholderiales bacterium]|nr:Rpn family recombination-promoting nuclease/putative transposase [Burkholderiales bacterium]